ncbi:OmpA family protein [Donghicola sp. XS_ASV15]|uniref:OmpA family protein n=1 Tax=Donghicola sp. XS_ASV15 TaxID=3241295 RepID=UPI0035162C14
MSAGFAQRALENGSFEENAPPLNGSSLYTVACSGTPRVVTTGPWGAYVAAADIPGWTTSANFDATGCGYSGDVMEFSRKNGGVAQDGDHYIELNSTIPTGVSQEICVRNGEPIGFSFWHKSSATTNGIAETIEMAIDDVVIATNTATNSWTEVSGIETYTGDSGLVNIQFRSTSPPLGSGYVLEGNLLDNVSLTFVPTVQYDTGVWSASESAASPTGPSVLVSGDVPAGGLSIPISIVGGTATEGDDFTYTDTISVPAGSYSDTPFAIKLTLVSDAISEGSETIVFGIGDMGTAGVVAVDDCVGDPVETAIFTIDDVAPALDAVEDTPAAVNGAVGGTIPNVVANDTLGGVAGPTIGTEVTLAVTGTAQDGTTALGLDVVPAAGAITFDAATGEVIVAAGTTAGTYLYTYEICDVLNSTNCDTAVVTIITDPQAAVAVDDTPAAVDGAAGATIPNVVANDTLGGVEDPEIGTDVTLAVTGTAQDGTTALALDVVPASGGITLDPATGEVIVAAGTTAGTYLFTYEICEVLNPTNCDTAVVTIVTDPQAAVAVDDTPAAVDGAAGATIPNVVANDTLGGVEDPEIGTDVTVAVTGFAQDGTTALGLDVVPASGGITLDAATGEVIVAAGTTAGTYLYTYEICEVLNPTNCDTAVVMIVTDPQAAVAVDDTPAAVDGAAGATIPNVVANDTLGGVASPTIGTEVTLAISGTAQDGATALGLDVVPASGGITLDPATGEVIVAAGTTAGTYLYTYEICEVLNPTNCDTAVVTISVGPATEATIEAVDDVPEAISGSDGATITNVLANDILDGETGPTIATDVVVYNSGSSQNGTTPIGLNVAPEQGAITFDASSGDIAIASGTSAGTYIYTYEICEVQNPTNCDNAVVTIRINPAEIDAVDDNFTASEGSSDVAGSAGPVLSNDTIDGLAVPTDGSLTTITLIDDGGMDGATLGTDGALTIPAGIAAGAYAVTYEICEVLNPTNCDQATAQVRVAEPDLLALIKEDLTKILNEDRAATIMQQAARMQGYSADGLQRLKSRTATACQQAVNIEAAKILFDTDRAVIKPQSDPTLDEIATILGSCKGVAFEIAGHTDSNASGAYNLDLSQRRAEAVLGALRARGVDTDGFAARAYGESDPSTSNATEAGRAENRRVEFRMLDAVPLVTTCQNGGVLRRRINGDADDDSAQFDGDFYRETYDCVREEWTIVDSALSFYESDDGQSQRQLNLSFRRERFTDENSLRGWFFGVYGSQNDVSGLADGEIAGFGLNGGLYGADQLSNGLYLDYYLGAAAGRHEFDLAFDRSIGTIDADGHYTYFAGFAGIAVSGDLDFGTVTMTPRAGLEYAYSPEADVEVTTSLDDITQYGEFSLSEVSGGRAFVELRHEWSIWEGLGRFALAPRIACYEPLFEEALGCTYGGYIEVEQADTDSPLAYYARLDMERGESFNTGSFTAGISRRMRQTVLRADATVDAEGQTTLGGTVEMNF